MKERLGIARRHGLLDLPKSIQAECVRPIMKNVVVEVNPCADQGLRGEEVIFHGLDVWV